MSRESAKNSFARNLIKEINIMEKLFAVAALIAGVFVLAMALGLLLAFPVMWLWNWLAPALGVSTLTYWQSWGIFVLCNLLFKPTVQKS